jgi:hypothetical protein
MTGAGTQSGSRGAPDTTQPYVLDPTLLKEAFGADPHKERPRHASKHTGAARDAGHQGHETGEIHAETRVHLRAHDAARLGAIEVRDGAR